MEIGNKHGGYGKVLKKTKWVTNCPALAQSLDQWCSNLTGGPVHKHVHLVGGIASAAAVYPPKLVRAVLVALRDQLRADKSLNSVMMQAAGPIPSEPWFGREEPAWTAEFEEKFWMISVELSCLLS